MNIDALPGFEQENGKSPVLSTLTNGMRMVKWYLSG